MRYSALFLILLIILLILGSIVKCSAQITIKEFESKHKTDTIKSIFLTTQVRDSVIGYEVIKYNGSTVEWYYLDKNKKPVSKNVIIWMSKPIK